MKESLQAQFATVRSNHEALQERVVKVEAGLTEKHDKLRSSLFAVYARERLRELAVEIKQDADDLYLRLKSGENTTWQLGSSGRMSTIIGGP